MNTFILVVWAFYGTFDGNGPPMPRTLVPVEEFASLEACKKAAENLAGAISHHLCPSQQ